MIRKLFLSSTFLLVLPLALSAARTVDLYSGPDTSATVVDTVPLDHPQLGEPVPVFDSAMAALGWHVAPFTTRQTGFVADSEIGKDLLPVPGAVLRADPTPTAPVLGTCVPGEAVDILDRGTFWKVRGPVQTSVYLLPETVPEVAADPPPIAPQPSSSTDPAAPSPAAAPEQSESDSTSADPGPVPLIETTPVIDADAAPAVTTTPAKATSSTTPTRFEGIFEKAPRRFLGLRKAPYPFQLVDPSGKRIGYIDTERILVTGSLQAYLDQEVILQALRTYDNKSKEWILKARTMQRK